MKSYFSILFLVISTTIAAQKQEIKYIKYTALYNDSTLNNIIIESNINKHLPFFRKETHFGGTLDKQNSVLVYAKDTLNSTYFAITLSYIRIENLNQLSIYHIFNSFEKDSLEEIVDIFIDNDSVHYSYIEVSIDGNPNTYRYQLPESSLDFYKSLAEHHFEDPDLRTIELTTRSFQPYGELLEKSYFNSYETEDSVYTYRITERYHNDTTLKDSILQYKGPCPTIKNYNLDYYIDDNIRKKKHRKSKLPTPYYLNPKYTKRIKKGYKYEIRLDKRDAPSYYEIFYE